MDLALFCPIGYTLAEYLRTLAQNLLRIERQHVFQGVIKNKLQNTMHDKKMAAALVNQSHKKKKKREREMHLDWAEIAIGSSSW